MYFVFVNYDDYVLYVHVQTLQYKSCRNDVMDVINVLLCAACMVILCITLNAYVYVLYFSSCPHPPTLCWPVPPETPAAATMTICGSVSPPSDSSRPLIGSL